MPEPRTVLRSVSPGHLSVVMIALAAGLLWAAPSRAQAPLASPTANLLRDVPTTEVLAIGSITPSANLAGLPSVMPDEVRDTVRLYLSGRIEQWFVRKDRPGVVFVLRTADLKEARATLDGLPFSKAGLMTFEVIPLGPLSPLGVLLTSKPAEPTR